MTRLRVIALPTDEVRRLQTGGPDANGQPPALPACRTHLWMRPDDGIVYGKGRQVAAAARRPRAEVAYVGVANDCPYCRSERE